MSYEAEREDRRRHDDKTGSDNKISATIITPLVGVKEAHPRRNHEDSMGHGHFEAVVCIKVLVYWLQEVPHTYLSNRPFKWNSAAATCRRFPSSGKKELRKPQTGSGKD